MTTARGGRPKLPALDPAKVGVFDLPEYSLRELAHRMNRHIDTLRDDCRTGRCPAKKVGGSVGWLVTEDQRRAYMLTLGVTGMLVRF